MTQSPSIPPRQQAWRRWLAFASAAALSACATHPARQALPPLAGDPQQHQQQRETALAAAPAWSLTGRVALSRGNDGGSGRIEWSQQAQGTYTVALSAPITRQSWRLTARPGQAALEGLDGGTREGPDAGALLLQATRWEIPVEALASWVRGGRADRSTFGAEVIFFAADGRISRIEQGGWRIDYADWRAVTGAPVELPHRLDAIRGDAKVRLIVDAWQ